MKLLSAVRSQLKKDWTFAIWLILPAALLISVFTVYPIVSAIVNSFYNWNLMYPDQKTFVGLDNYSKLLGSQDFIKVIFNTIYFTIGTVPTGLFLSLLIAIPLSRKLAGLTIYRTVYFAPVVTPVVAVSLGWMLLYDANFGLLNYVLESIGLPPQPWLALPKTAMLAVIIMSVWKGLGTSIILFIAGINAIPRELYEAARIDGAGEYKQFWRITWPLLTPTTFFVLIISTIGSFQAFGQIYIMTKGGPVNATTTIVYDLYRNAFEFFKMGYASAQGVILFVILAVFTLIQWQLSKKHQGGLL